MTMNLRPRFLLITVLFFVVIAAPMWLALRFSSEQIVGKWALRFAEKQVLYDKSRTLQPILREVALSRQLADSSIIRQWARNPDNPEMTQLAILEMEAYRPNFQDKSYFAALYRNGKYYHNNATNDFSGKEHRYTLDPQASKDAWFFNLIRLNVDVHINVKHDAALGITRLWIDSMIRDEGQVLGFVGTGLDLSGFTDLAREDSVPGVTSLFVDRDGAIQIMRKDRQIDFGLLSQSGSGGQKQTVWQLFDREADYNTVKDLMQSVKGEYKANAEGKIVSMIFADLQGKRHLIGVTYLPEVDWHEVTLLDLEVLMPYGELGGLLLTCLLLLAALSLLFNIGLRHYVSKPLERLEQLMQAVDASRECPEADPAQFGTGEVRRLMEGFVAVQHKMQERMTAMDQKMKIDPMTELLNRHGMQVRLEEEFSRADRGAERMGILWVNIDNLKEINDRFGHASGDAVVQGVALQLRQIVRPYDALSRWGGYEFLVLLSKVDQASLDKVGERLLAGIENCTSLLAESGEVGRIIVSIGGHLQLRGESIDSMLHEGDLALLAAKALPGSAYQSSRAARGIA